MINESILDELNLLGAKIRTDLGYDDYGKNILQRKNLWLNESICLPTFILVANIKAIESICVSN